MHFIVPKFSNDSVRKLLNRFGFENISSFDFTSYYQYKKIFVDEKIWQIRKVEFYSSEKGLIKTLFLKEIMLESQE